MSVGVASNGAVVEVFASAHGSWTIIMTYPTGMSCMMAAGDNWEILPQPVHGAKS